MVDQMGALRRRAWTFGREVRNRLVGKYRLEYGLEIGPAPVLIVDELLTDFLGVDLRYDPLPLDRYAETEWIHGRAVVTVTSLTIDIPGIKDAGGIQNVTKCHEVMHVVRDPEVVSTDQ